MNTFVRSESSFIITQVDTNEFLIEGAIEYAKFGCENTEYNLTFADINGGPFLHIGKDFFGRGKVMNIEKLDTDKEDYLILKVKVED